MKDQVAEVVSDEDFASRAERWAHDTPDTKEAYYIRDVFDSLFPSEAAASTAVRYVMTYDLVSVNTMLNFTCLSQMDPERGLGLRC